MAYINIRQGWQRNGYHDPEPRTTIGSPSLIRLRKQSLSEIGLRLPSDSESPEGGYHSEQLVQDDGQAEEARTPSVCHGAPWRRVSRRRGYLVPGYMMI